MKTLLQIAIVFGALVLLNQAVTALAGGSKAPVAPNNNTYAAAPIAGGGGCCGGGSSTGSSYGFNSSKPGIGTSFNQANIGSGPNVGGGCGSSSAGSGGCGMGSGSNSADKSATLADAEKAGLEYYKSKGGTGDVTAKATDYGCHVQVDILQNGAIVASYGYSGGQIN